MAELPLIGLCKNCKRAASGTLLSGRFLCQRCADQTGADFDRSALYRYHFTFSTNSNSANSSVNRGENE